MSNGVASLSFLGMLRMGAGAVGRLNPVGRCHCCWKALPLVAVLALAGISHSAAGADYRFAPTGAGPFIWASGSNWTTLPVDNSEYPHRSGDRALFSILLQPPPAELGTVILPTGEVSVGGLELYGVAGSRGWRLTAGGGLAFDHPGGNAEVIDDSEAAVRFETRVRLASDLEIDVRKRAGSVTFAGPIEGGASRQLVKQGLGTATLLAASNYGGNTYVLGGKLSITNQATLATNHLYVDRGEFEIDDNLFGVSHFDRLTQIPDVFLSNSRFQVLGPGQSTTSQSIGRVTIAGGSTLGIAQNPSDPEILPAEGRAFLQVGAIDRMDPMATLVVAAGQSDGVGILPVRERLRLGDRGESVRVTGLNGSEGGTIEMLAPWIVVNNRRGPTEYEFAQYDASTDAFGELGVRTVRYAQVNKLDSARNGEVLSIRGQQRLDNIPGLPLQVLNDDRSAFALRTDATAGGAPDIQFVQSSWQGPTTLTLTGGLILNRAQGGSSRRWSPSGQGRVDLALGGDVPFPMFVAGEGQHEGWRIDSRLSGTHGFIKAGTGRLVLAGDNRGLKGTIAVNGGCLRLEGSYAVDRQPIHLHSSDALASESASGRLDVAADVTLGGLLGNGLVVSDVSNVASGAAVTLTLEVPSGEMYDFSGDFASLNNNSRFAHLEKTGPGVQVFSGAVRSHGNLTVAEGTLRLQGGGHVANASAVRIVGAGNLELNNLLGSSSDRLQNGVDVSLDGGRLAMIGGAAATNEVIDEVSLLSSGVISIQAAAGQSTRLTINQMQRDARGTVVFQAAALGSATEPGGAQAYVLSGFEMRNGVAPFALVSESLNGMPATFASYHPATGVVPASGLVPYASAASGTNAYLTSTPSPRTVKTLNSLRIDAQSRPIDLLGSGAAGASLTLESGGLLILGQSPVSIAGWNAGLATPNGELIVHQYNSGGLTIASPIVSSGITKSGPGKLTLAAEARSTAATVINEGVISMAPGGRLLSPDVIIHRGGRLAANGLPNVLGSPAQSLVVNGGVYDNGGGIDSIGSLVVSQGGAVLGSGRLTLSGDLLGHSGRVESPLDVAGAIRKSTKGTLILGGQNVVVGDTTISAGALVLSNSAAVGSRGTVVVGDEPVNDPLRLLLGDGVNLTRPVVVSPIGGNGVVTLGMADGGAGSLDRVTLHRNVTIDTPVSDSHLTIQTIDYGVSDNRIRTVTKTGEGQLTLAGYASGATGTARIELDTRGGTTVLAGGFSPNQLRLDIDGAAVSADVPLALRGLVLGSDVNMLDHRAATLVVNGGKSENLTLNSGSTLVLSGRTEGKLRLDPAVGTTVTIGSGATAVIQAGAQLEIAGQIPSTSARDVHLNVLNQSNRGLRIAAANQSLGVVDGTGSVSVAPSSQLSATYLRQHRLTIEGANAKAIIRSDGELGGLSVLDELVMGMGGILDLNDNDLVLNYAGVPPLAQVRQMVADGLIGHSSAPQIVSTRAKGMVGPGDPLITLHVPFDNALVGLSDWLGYPLVGRNQVILKYTYFGDLNLDGMVDASDYLTIDGHFGERTEGGPLAGDANLDGQVDAADYLTVDNAFGLGSISPLASGGLTELANAVLVPEPGSAILLAILSVAMGAIKASLGWRRRIP